MAAGEALTPPLKDFNRLFPNLESQRLFHNQTHNPNLSKIAQAPTSPHLEKGQIHPSKDGAKSSFVDVVRGQTISPASDTALSLHSHRLANPVRSSLGTETVTFVPLKPIAQHQGKPSVLFTISDKKSLLAKMNHVLVGKFSHWRPPLPFIKSFFGNLKLQGNYTISLFDNKHLFIGCDCEIDFHFIWLRLNWTIHGKRMRVFKWEPTFSSAKESSLAPVWVRFEGIPLYMFDDLSLRSIANSIGKPIKVDPNNISRLRVDSARVCVELDISKPFIDCIWVSFIDEDSNEVLDGFWVHVIYDFIPHYCSFCHHMGHALEGCKRINSASVPSRIGVEEDAPNTIQQELDVLPQAELIGPSVPCSTSCQTHKPGRVVFSKVWKPKGAQLKDASQRDSGFQAGLIAADSELQQTSSRHMSNLVDASGLIVKNQFHGLLLEEDTQVETEPSKFSASFKQQQQTAEPKSQQPSDTPAKMSKQLRADLVEQDTVGINLKDQLLHPDMLKSQVDDKSEQENGPVTKHADLNVSQEQKPQSGNALSAPQIHAQTNTTLRSQMSGMEQVTQEQPKQVMQVQGSPSWADMVVDEEIKVISQLTLSGAKDYARKQIEEIMRSDDEDCKTPVRKSAAIQRGRTLGRGTLSNVKKKVSDCLQDSSKVFCPGLYPDCVVSIEGVLELRMSQVTTDNFLLVARRSVSPKERSSQKLKSLPKKVDTLDYLDNKADLVERAKYCELGHELRSNGIYELSY